MKKYLRVAVVAFFALSLFGCQGEEGPQGPTGPEGPEGPRGETGEQGMVGWAMHLGCSGQVDATEEWVDLDDCEVEYAARSEDSDLIFTLQSSFGFLDADSSHLAGTCELRLVFDEDVIAGGLGQNIKAGSESMPQIWSGTMMFAANIGDTDSHTYRIQARRDDDAPVCVVGWSPSGVGLGQVSFLFVEEFPRP
jgi:hypothetical protein